MDLSAESNGSVKISLDRGVRQGRISRGAKISTPDFLESDSNTFPKSSLCRPIIFKKMQILLPPGYSFKYLQSLN
jgi:hypothetical protein